MPTLRSQITCGLCGEAIDSTESAHRQMIPSEKKTRERCVQCGKEFHRYCPANGKRQGRPPGVGGAAGPAILPTLGIECVGVPPGISRQVSQTLKELSPPNCVPDSEHAEAKRVVG